MSEIEPAEARTYPSTIGGLFFLVLLGVALAGIGVAASGRWLLGVRCLAVAVLGASVLRALLPEKDAGMLAVRGRVFDASLTAGIGLALWFLADSLPNG